MDDIEKCFMCQGEASGEKFDVHIREYHKIVTDVELILKLQLQSDFRKSLLILTPPESPSMTPTEAETLKTPPKGVVTPLDVYEAMGMEMPISPQFKATSCLESTPICDKLKSRVESVSKPETISFSLAEEIKDGKTLAAEELQLPTNVKMRSKTVDQQGGSKEPSKSRKRKSLEICQNVNAVSNKIQFWKGKENVSKSIDNKNFISSNSVNLFNPKREEKSEGLVNELLKQTLVKHLKGQKSADDTIIRFDEIFATNCPFNMDESLEDNFNLLLGDDMVCDSAREDVEDFCPSEVAQCIQLAQLSEDITEEEDCPDETGKMMEANDIDDVLNEGTEVVDEGIDQASPGQIIDGLPSNDEDIVENLPSSVEKIPSESGKLDETNPDLNLSTFGTPTEKVEGKYRCSSCSKDFKFLTYLKSHQNSKSGCVSSAGKRRSSMNFSKIQYLD